MGDLIQCAACANAVSVEAAACPKCGQPVPKSAKRGARVGRPALALVIGGSALALAGAFIWSMITSKPTRTAQAETPVATAAAPTAAPEPVDPILTALAKIDALPCANAFAATKVAMGDSSNEDNPGSIVFGRWAARRMRWADVSVPEDETTFALVQKDSEEQLGKRMCSGGGIIEIHALKPSTGGKLAVGILLSEAGHLYRFLAAGSTGDLVAQGYGRLCGMVTGNYNYSNSAGGTGHAVAIVGMFDLPQNKAASTAAFAR